MSGVSSTATLTAQNGAGGGLVGQALADASVTDSYSTGAVSGGSADAGLGGIVGASCDGGASVQRTYFAGTLTPTPGVSVPTGGIIGSTLPCFLSAGALSIVGANAWNADTVGARGAVSGVGAGQTTAQMKTLGTYTALGWSMVNGWEAAGSSTWGICSQVNGGYPFLQRTGVSSPCTAPTQTGGATPPVLLPTILPSRSRMVSGQSVRVGLRTRNEGGSQANSVVSCLGLPVNLVVARAPGAVRSGRTLCFRLGTVAVGATVTRTITARAVSTRRVVRSVRATAKASGLDRVSATPKRLTIVPRAARPVVTG